MLKHYAPTAMPKAGFSAAVEISKPSRILCISGQVARDADGQIPEGIEAQAELIWKNLSDVLASASMSVENLVELTIYLTSRDDGPGFDRVRAKFLNGARPASTKIIVSGFVDARMICEVQATAAD